MNVFLVLSSSAVAFYVFILLALWRDSRKRRNGHVASCVSAGFNQVWGIEAGGFKTRSRLQRFKFSDDVLWVPLTKLHLEGRRRTTQAKSKPVQPVTSQASMQ
jgi:hypothetical protein